MPVFLRAPSGLPPFPYMPPEAAYNEDAARDYVAALAAWRSAWDGTEVKIPRGAYLAIENGWPENRHVPKGGIYRFVWSETRGRGAFLLRYVRPAR